jgi:hypothetical protein
MCLSSRLRVWLQSAMHVHHSATFVVATLRNVRVLLVLCHCVCPTPSWSDFFADRSGTNRTRDRRTASVRVSFRFSFLANAKQKVGSKTCSGLTYLELVLVDIVGLEEVSMAENADCVAGTHKSAHEYLAGGFWDSRSGRCGFGLFRLLGRLSDTAYGAGRSRSSSIGAAASTSATLGLATGLEDIIEAGVELGRHGDAGVVNAKVRRVSEAR